MTNGTAIGRYLVHYQNGQSNSLAVWLGQHLGHGERQTNEPASAWEVAWEQST